MSAATRPRTSSVRQRMRYVVCFDLDEVADRLVLQIPDYQLMCDSSSVSSRLFCLTRVRLSSQIFFICADVMGQYFMTDVVGSSALMRQLSSTSTIISNYISSSWSQVLTFAVIVYLIYVVYNVGSFLHCSTPLWLTFFCSSTLSTDILLSASK